MVIELGSKVRDPITEVEGIAISRTTFLQGCERIQVQAPIGKDGKVPDTLWVDEPQLEVLAPPKARKTTGAISAG